MSTAQLLQLGDGGKSLAGSARGWAGMHPVQLGSSPSTQLLISLSLCCPETSPGLKSPQSPAWAARAAQFPPRDATRAGSWLLQAQRRGTDSHHSPAGHVWAGNATDTLLPSPTALHEVRTLLFGGDAGLPTLALGLWVPASLAPFLLLPPCIPTASRSPRLAEPGAVPEPRRAAPGDQLPLRARCHPPVLPALRGHLPLLHGAQALQEQPLLSHRGKQPCRVFGVHGWFPTLWLFWGWSPASPGKSLPVCGTAASEAGERLLHHPGHPHLLCHRRGPWSGDPQTPCSQRAEGDWWVGNWQCSPRGARRAGAVGPAWPFGHTALPRHRWVGEDTRAGGCCGLCKVSARRREDL